MTARSSFFVLAFALCMAASQAFAQSPPVGNNMPVQPTKTSGFTVKSTDLKTMIPMNCSAPCTVTLPHSTSSFPKGYPVIIQTIGSSSVTIAPTPTSTIYGLPTTGGNLVLSTSGNWVSLTADQANNYLAYGQIGSGGGGGVFVVLATGNGLALATGSGLGLGN
jgi:hypothetical protein